MKETAALGVVILIVISLSIGMVALANSSIQSRDAMLAEMEKQSRERISSYQRACSEAGGVPAHDGRQMVCIK